MTVPSEQTTEIEDIGAILTVQLVEWIDSPDGPLELKMTQFDALTHNLGRIGNKGRFRRSDDQPWEWCEVHGIVTRTDGTIIYCINHTTSPVTAP